MSKMTSLVIVLVIIIGGLILGYNTIVNNLKFLARCYKAGSDLWERKYNALLDSIDESKCSKKGDKDE